jgi:surface protein
MQTKIRDRNHLDYIIQQEMRSHGVYVDLNHLDVSSVTDMSYLFYGKKFKGNISKWDTSNVTQMNAMFWNSSFSGDISCWDTSNVQNMDSMFYNSQFNGDISGWDVSNVRAMHSMFCGAVFSGNLSRWDVSNVTDMYKMFSFSQFNGDVSTWNVENVREFSLIFAESKFEGDISAWRFSPQADVYKSFTKFHPSPLGIVAYFFPEYRVFSTKPMTLSAQTHIQLHHSKLVPKEYPQLLQALNVTESLGLSVYDACQFIYQHVYGSPTPSIIPTFNDFQVN